MQFNKEPQYFNRYSRNKKYQEWRALAGEVPQSAEFNEIQALLKDRVQQAGEAIFQNGDIISGMALVDGTVKDASGNVTSGSYSLPKSELNKIWIDGSIHSANEAATIEPHKDGWGFIGVFLERILVDYTGDSDLRDPAVRDINGTYLGLAGATRLKTVPVWVAGSLNVSKFTENDVKNVVIVEKVKPASGSGQIGLERLAEVDLKENVVSSSVYNSKFVLTNVIANNSNPDINEFDLIYKNPNFITTRNLKVDNWVNLSIKINLPSGYSGNVTSVSGKISFLSTDLNQEIASGDTETIAFNNRSLSKTFKIKIDESKFDTLKAEPFHVSCNVKLDSGMVFPKGTEVFLSDIYYSSLEEDTRKPVFTKFTMASGSSYSNFTPGPNSSIYVSQQIVNGKSVSKTPISTYAGQVPDNENIVIRKSEITEEEDLNFLDNYGVRKEEACIRIYPVHITKNGVITSSLAHREFTNISNNYFAERFKNVISTKSLSKPTITPVEGSANKFKISMPEAFVEGRYLANREEVITLPSNVSDLTSYSFTLPYLTNTAFTPDFQVKFEAISKIFVTCVFKETITRKQDETSNFQNLQDTAKDCLSVYVKHSTTSDLNIQKSLVSNVEILKVTNVPGTVVYTQGAAPNDPLAAYVQSGVAKTTELYSLSEGNIDFYRPVVRWLNNAAAPEPSRGDSYVVYYKADVELSTSDFNNVSNDSFYSSFKLKAAQSTSGISNASKLDRNIKTGVGETAVIEANLIPLTTLFGYPSKLIKTETNQFYSELTVVDGTIGSPDSFIVFLAGNYEKDGPDGYFDFVAVKQSDVESYSSKLLKENKLPVAFITPSSTSSGGSGGPTPSSPVVEDLASKSDIDPAEQKELNFLMQNLKKELPALLSQNMYVSDASSGPAIKYTNLPVKTFKGLSRGPSEEYLVKSIKWTIDPERFLRLANYTVEVEYSYYGESTIPDYISTENENIERKAAIDSTVDGLTSNDKNGYFYGLLLSFKLDIKNTNGTPVSSFAAIPTYNTAYYDGRKLAETIENTIFDTSSDVEQAALIRSIDVHDLLS